MTDGYIDAEDRLNDRVARYARQALENMKITPIRGVAHIKTTWKQDNGAEAECSTTMLLSEMASDRGQQQAMDQLYASIVAQAEEEG